MVGPIAVVQVWAITVLDVPSERLLMFFARNLGFDADCNGSGRAFTTRILPSSEKCLVWPIRRKNFEGELFRTVKLSLSQSEPQASAQERLSTSFFKKI